MKTKTINHLGYVVTNTFWFDIGGVLDTRTWIVHKPEEDFINTILMNSTRIDCIVITLYCINIGNLSMYYCRYI